MTRNSSTAIAAKVVRVGRGIKGFKRGIRIELDDDRVTAGHFSFAISPDIYFPFPEGENVAIIIRRMEK